MKHLVGALCLVLVSQSTQAQWFGSTVTEESLPNDFLNSMVFVRPGIADFGDVKVKEYVKVVSEASREECEWSHAGDEYNMTCQFAKRIVFSFTWSEGAGASRVRTYMGLLNREMPALEVSTMVFSLHPKARESNN